MPKKVRATMRGLPMIMLQVFDHYLFFFLYLNKSIIHLYHHTIYMWTYIMCVDVKFINLIQTHFLNVLN